MRFILLTILLMWNNQGVGNGPVVICKHGNSIRIEYIDSIKGIVSLESKISSDTMHLTIKVSTVYKAKDYELALPSKVRFIQYGNVVKEVDQLPVCSNAKVLSGKEALEYLKHNQ